MIVSQHGKTAGSGPARLFGIPLLSNFAIDSHSMLIENTLDFINRL